MEKDILSFIKKHGLMTRDARVVVGVSGGPDSMALLHFLHTIKGDWNLDIVAVTVDHQLREASAADVAYVKAVAESWDIPLVTKQVDVQAYKQEHKLSTEVAARKLRYMCYEQVMQQEKADFLMLGHHADDQLETMLMNMTRTASSAAFGGIPLIRDFATGKLVRPLLAVTREAIEAYCQEHGIEARIDITNKDESYTRNYYRHKVVPHMKEKNPNIHRTIQYLTEGLQEDEEFLQEEAKKWMKNHVRFHPEKRVAVFSAELFENSANALQRRTFHLILNYLYDRLPKDLSYIHEEQFLALLKQKNGNKVLDFPQRLQIRNAYGEITLAFVAREHPAPAEITLEVPGGAVIWDGTSISASFTDTLEKTDRNTHAFQLPLTALPLHIRTRKHGDRMQWEGLQGRKKLKKIFIDAKIPQDKRDHWPIVTDNHGHVLWVVGLKKGQRGTNDMKDPVIRLKIENPDNIGGFTHGS